MNELNGADRTRAKPLFAGLSETDLSVLTVIEGRSPGRVWVDNDQAPRVGFLTSPEGGYLAGDCDAAKSYAPLKALIPFRAYLTVHPHGWGPKLGGVWSNGFAREHLRRHYRFKEMRLGDWRERVPDGYRVAAVDADLLVSGRRNVSDVLGLVEDNWLSRGDFLSKGFGFCMIHGEAVVAWCLSDCVSGGRCEIGINTEVGYRRRGLAALTAAATISHCLDNGVETIGWHCLANNEGSRRTAEKVGFVLDREYSSFSSGFPAQNVGDMGQDAWMEWAHFYAVAGREDAIFRYNEASCRAQGGDEERALEILQQILQEILNAGSRVPWDWLDGEWTLAPLRRSDAWHELIGQLPPRGED